MKLNNITTTTTTTREAYGLSVSECQLKILSSEGRPSGRHKMGLDLSRVAIFILLVSHFALAEEFRDDDNKNVEAEEEESALRLTKRTVQSYLAEFEAGRLEKKRARQEPPSELVFSNQTGAVARCGVALDLARSIARAEQGRPNKEEKGGAAQLLGSDIQIRWEKENGEEIEPTLYAANSPAELAGNARGRLLRYVRQADGALVFEPFRGTDFRPEVHASAYRCVASSGSRGASVVSRDMHVKAVVSGQLLAPEVLDELVIDGNSALFKCQIPHHAQDYLQVLDWIEYPTETIHSFQSTTLANLNHLFHPQEAHNLRRRQQENRTTSLGRYFMAPKSGDLHILNADISLNYRAFKCRCKNKLTGELLSSLNKGKLIVTESHAPVAPRLVMETPRLSSFEEGELAMLSCNLQSYPRAQISWFRKANGEQTSEPIDARDGNGKYVQLGTLLLIAHLNRNDSGVYLCQVKNSVGEERLEQELQVRGSLSVKLSASASVLELGKSLALDCTVTGFPIHQVVFRHNQNVIKSMSGNAANSAANHHLHHYSNHNRRQPAASHRASASSYFVVDSSASPDGGALGVAPPAGAQQQAINQQTVNDGKEVGAGLLTTSAAPNLELPGPADEEDDASEGGGSQIKLSHVIVIVLEPQHAGAYQCFAYNQYESVQSSAYIRVLDDPPKFKDTFKSDVFEQRQDISLQCSARANPLPEITWSIDGQPVPESGRTRFGDFVTKENLVISYVNISQTQVTDSGQYKCSADNGLAQVSHQAQISVLGPIQIKQMANVTVVASTSFRIRCPVAGYPVSEIQWLHNGRRLPANHRQHVYENGTLEVEHMEKSHSDDGEYTCLATGGPQSARQTAQGSVHVSIKVRPTIEPFAISRSLREGQRASIMCTISSGDLPISISWYRNDQALLPSGDSPGAQLLPQVAAAGAAGEPLAGVRISRVSDYSSTLLFESLLVQHSANYTCLARNDAGSVSHQAPMIVQVAPKWTIEPADTNIVRGSGASIDCMAAGFPPPRIIWTKASSAESSSLAVASAASQARQVEPSKSHHLGSWRSIVSSPHLQVYENGSLNILDARDTDLGNYMCQATNGVGPGLSKVIKVTINVAAQFNTRHSIQYVVKGEQANLKCQAKGDWPLTIHWFKNKNRLEPINLQDGPAPSASPGSQQLIISSTLASVLMVPGSSSSPLAGSPSNQLEAHKLKGSVIEQLNSLLLLASPGADNQPANKQQGGGLLMHKYSLAVTDFALSGGETPNQLDKQTFLEQLSQLKQQFVSSSQQQTQLLQQPLLSQETSLLTINQVERQDTSTFKCFAANQFGLDERTIQLIVQEAPERIEELSVLELNSRSITLGWLAPYDGNSPILNYHIQYKPVNGPTSHPSSGQMSPETLNSLNWFNYTLPASGVVTHIGESSQEIGNLANNYQQDSKLKASTVAPSGGRTLVRITISSLRPVTHYWFRIEAENKLGNGPISSVLETLTMEEAPGSSPSKLKATAQSSSSILVSWMKLNERESFGSVHGYYVAYKPFVDNSTAAKSNINDNLKLEQEGAAQQSTTTAANIYKTIQHDDKLSKFDALLTGLKRSTKYMISVQAYNARGTGPSSEPIVIKTLEMDPPKQVKLYVKQSSNCTIQLEWRPMSQGALALLQQQQQEQNFQNKQLLEAAPANDEDNSSSRIPIPLSIFMPDSSRQQQNVAERQQTKQQASDPDVVDYYSLYQAELNDRPRWQEIRLPGHSHTHTIENLRCGTRYQFYMMGVNKIGVGDQSDILDTKTAGGLPLAPDRQSTFDVINATCYIIRLDHWQDNGCPIREFNLRYKAEASRDWIQLAHFNLPTWPPEQPSGDREKARSYFGAESTTVKSIVRAKREIDESKLEAQDVYIYPMDDARDEEDAFLDYSADISSIDSADYEASLESKSAVIGNETSSVQLPEQNVYSLLKDSMLPTLDSDELVQSRITKQTSIAQQWQANSNLLENENNPKLSLRNNNEQQDDQQRELIRFNLQQQQLDWHRVRLCNLMENVYYSVQITSLNSVGETEAELRLLTSQEALEYNQELKRQVVGRLGGDKFLQASAISDRLSLFAMNQWPILLPITLTITLMTVIFIVALLLKRSISSAPNSTTTTATSTMSTSSNHCQDYLDESHAGHYKSNGGGAPSAITDAATIGSDSMTIAGANLNSDRYVLANAAFNNTSLYQQHCSNQSVFGEPAYGIVGLNQFNNQSNEATNRSSNSPATTAIGSSLNSGSSGHPNTAMPLSYAAQSCYQQDQQQQQTRARNVYLCAKDESKGEAIFYGLPQQAGNIYNPSVQNQRHYAPQEAQMKQTEGFNQQQLFQPTVQEIYATQQQLEQLNGANNSAPVARSLDDRRFMSIVEEVARASDDLNQQRQLNQQQQQVASGKHLPEQLLPISDNQPEHCAQLDCYNQQTFNMQDVNSYPSNVGTQPNEEQQKMILEGSNRLMFDPVYATIRRTFPQAFKYLTLQQQHNPQRISTNQQHLLCTSQRHSLNDESQFNKTNQIASNDDSALHQQLQQDMTALLDSTNLAALNLLTPTATANQNNRT